MDHVQAMQIINSYGDARGIGGLLERLEAMKVDPNLTNLQRAGFNFIFDGMRRLFHGDG